MGKLDRIQIALNKFEDSVAFRVLLALFWGGLCAAFSWKLFVFLVNLAVE